MSEGWGDALSCDRCGHPAGWHGTTFCQVEAGAASKRRCDCPGWRSRPIATLNVELLAEAIDFVTRSSEPWRKDINNGREWYGTPRELATEVAARLHERTEP